MAEGVDRESGDEEGAHGRAVADSFRNVFVVQSSVSGDEAQNAARERIACARRVDDSFGRVGGDGLHETVAPKDKGAVLALLQQKIFRREALHDLFAGRYQVLTVGEHPCLAVVHDDDVDFLEDFLKLVPGGVDVEVHGVADLVTVRHLFYDFHLQRGENVRQKERFRLFVVLRDLGLESREDVQHRAVRVRGVDVVQVRAGPAESLSAFYDFQTFEVDAVLL